MVTPYEDGEHRSLLLSTVVLIEGLHVSILDRGSHAVQVTTVTTCLYQERE